MVSTKLVLLQSNMTYMYKKRGPQYHWVVELFRLLKLPVYDGVETALEKFNKLRNEDLDRKKTDRYKKRRIQLKVERTNDRERRKAWSKKHGHDTYGDDDSDDSDIELKPKKGRKRPKSTGGMCKCGSTTHLRSNHRECPYNMKRKKDAPAPQHEDDSVREQ